VKYDVVKKLCLIGGTLIFARYFFSKVPTWNMDGISETNLSTEWLRGE